MTLILQVGIIGYLEVIGPSANKLASGSLEQFIAEHYWEYTRPVVVLEVSRATSSWKWRA